MNLCFGKWRFAALALCVALCPVVLGCGKQTPPEPKANVKKKPAPTVNVTPPKPKEAKKPAPKPAVKPKEVAPPSVPGNLIPNGSFEVWQNAAFPSPFSGKLPAAIGEISRAAGQAAHGKNALQQTWKQSDGTESAVERFGVTVTGLKPNTAYRFSVQAKTATANRVSIAVYSMSSDKPPKVLENMRKGVTIGASEGFKRYIEYFSTKNETTLRFAVLCVPGDFPVSVEWDDWQLVSLGPAAVAAPASPVAAPAADAPKADAKPEEKPEAKSEAKPEEKPEAKPDAKPEEKPEAKPDAKTEEKPEAKPDAKPEEKPEAKPEVKPEEKENKEQKEPAEAKK